MKKINIVELLNDCPKGMELYSPLCGDCKLYDITDYTIRIETPNKDTLISLYHDGRYCSGGEIMLFPKGKITWDGFVPPCKFKDGDVIYNRLQKKICIYYSYGDGVPCIKGCRYNESNIQLKFEKLEYPIPVVMQDYRLATEEEKQKLFDAIKDNGYKWNTETKILEKLVEPRFKVGDRIKSVISSAYYTVVDIKNNNYFIKSDTEKYPYQVSFENEINYKLVPDKFDITTLVPFESRVLVRDYDNQIWMPTFWGKYLEGSQNCSYLTTNGCYKYCVPYDDNQELLGTIDDCEEFYKTWK